MKLSFAELHNPAFLAGTNLGMKLEIRNTTKGPVQLDYIWKEVDQGKGQFFLRIMHKNRKLLVPESNIIGMEEIEEFVNQVEVTPVVATPTRARGKVTAQVSGPHDHVFAGQGAGKTNDH